jgi:hypothetical protein
MEKPADLRDEARIPRRRGAQASCALVAQNWKPFLFTCTSLQLTNLRLAEIINLTVTAWPRVSVWALSRYMISMDGRIAAKHRAHTEATMTKLGTVGWCVPALIAVGCAAESPDPGEATQLDQINMHTLTLADLTSSALTTLRLDAASAPAMASTPAARKVLTFAVACALDSTQTITFNVGGTLYTATGGVGIAPGWTAGALTPTQAAWVSACLFANVNDTSTLVWISLRGAESSFATSLDERAQYQIEEGAFWGNAFSNLGPVMGYSCNGVGQSANPLLPLRQCAQWDGVLASNRSPCGMSYAGRCSQVCAGMVAPYSGCSFLGSAAAGSVVTIFLAGVH